MFTDLQGKTVLITGASTGIGAAVARSFGALGARVTIHYNNNKTAAEAVLADIQANGGEAFLLQGDLTDPAVCEAVVNSAAKLMGGLDILINNAGTMCGRTSFAVADIAQYEQVMNVNVRSVFAACRAALPIMHTRGKGNIINVTSIAARNGGGGGAGLYASAKGFVSTMTRAAAKEEALNNIRINAVAPGVITTPFHERYSNEEQLEAMRKTVPMGRLGTAEECVGAFLFLASDQLSSYVTGQIIEVNGGQLMP